MSFKVTLELRREGPVEFYYGAILDQGGRVVFSTHHMSECKVRRTLTTFIQGEISSGGKGYNQVLASILARTLISELSSCNLPKDLLDYIYLPIADALGSLPEDRLRGYVKIREDEEKTT